MDHTAVQSFHHPEGEEGIALLKKMNDSHKPLRDWALPLLHLPQTAHILDVGCGGGAAVADMLKLCPAGVVDGLDYSGESVRMSLRVNEAEVGRRCSIQQGDVGSLPYGEETYDFVTAFETVYFWPDLPRAFSEVKRVLKPGGRLMVVCEVSDAQSEANQNRMATIPNMTVYPPDKLQEYFEEAGLANVEVHTTDGEWICIIGEKNPVKIQNFEQLVEIPEKMLQEALRSFEAEKIVKAAMGASPAVNALLEKLLTEINFSEMRERTGSVRIEEVVKVQEEAVAFINEKSSIGK